MFVLFLSWDLKYTGLVTNFGPVPFVPWGTSRSLGRSKTQREGFYCPGTIGSRSNKNNKRPQVFLLQGGKAYRDTIKESVNDLRTTSQFNSSKHSHEYLSILFLSVIIQLLNSTAQNKKHVSLYAKNNSHDNSRFVM